MKRKLGNKLSPENDTLKVDWEIGDCVGCFYRPNFENLMYPYLPPHITKPKEIKTLYMVHLPSSCYFAVPSNLKLIAVPMFELYDKIDKYGPLIAGLPSMLSRFQVSSKDTEREREREGRERRESVCVYLLT